MDDFQKELKQLLNKHSRENDHATALFRLVNAAQAMLDAARMKHIQQELGNSEALIEH
jgi:hypothetical protein